MDIDFLMRTMDDDVVVCRDPRAAEIEIGSVLVLASSTGRVVQLDDRARLLWTLFDGEVTIGQLADDICAEFLVDRDQVLEDIGDFVAALLTMSLLVDLAFDEPQQPSTAGDGSGQLFTMESPEPCCGSELLDRDWLPTIAVRVGNHVLGIQTDVAAIADAIRQLLSPMLVEGIEPPNNLAIVFRPPDEQWAEPQLSLYAQAQPVLRSSESAMVRDSLSLHLTALGSRTESGRLWVQAWPLGNAAGVVLLDADFVPALGMLRDAVARRGWQQGGGMTSIDVATREVVIDRSKVRYDGAGMEAFDSLSEWPDSGLGLLPDGRYPLRAFAIVPPLPEDALTLPNLPTGGLYAETRVLQVALPLIGGLAGYGVAEAAREVLELAWELPMSQPPANDFLAWLEQYLA